MPSRISKFVDRSDSSNQSVADRNSVNSYIYWRNPKSSGIIFGAGLILLYSLAYSSLISVISNVGLAVLAVSAVFRFYNGFRRFLNKKDATPFCKNEFLDCIILSQETTHEIVDMVIVHLNAFLVELRRLFLIEDIVMSSKFALVLLFLRYIGAWFNGLTIVIIVFVSAFTLPKIYENNKIQIDGHLTFIRKKIQDAITRIRNAILTIPSQKTKIKEK